MFRKLLVSGNHYEIGFKLGKFYKKSFTNNINEYMEKLNDNNISETLDKTIKHIEEVFPWCLEEIKGKADGAEVDFRALALMHNPEIFSKPDGCTTIMYKNDKGVLFCHNEDDMDLNHDDVALIEYKYDDHFVVSFTPYTKLSGSCFGYNSYGLVFSCNYLFHDKLDLNNLSRYIISRDLIESKTIDECIEKLNKNKPAQPFSFNVLDINSNRVINIENDFNQLFITEIENKFSRSNHFLNKEMIKTENSKWRYIHTKEGMDKLCDNPSIDDLISILSYEADSHVESVYMRYSKYKDDPNDPCCTLANFAVDNINKKIILRDCMDDTMCELSFNGIE